MNNFQNQQRVRVLGRADIGTLPYMNNYAYNGIKVWNVMFDDCSYHNIPEDMILPYDGTPETVTIYKQGSSQIPRD